MKNTADKEITYTQIRRNIVWLWLGGFIVPPVGWVLGNWFLGLWSTQEMLAVTFSPLLFFYVTGYIIITVFFLTTRFKIIEAYTANPESFSLEKTQRVTATLPKAFLVLITIYCIIGPNTDMLGKEFLDSTEYLLGELLGIPFILLFSIPFFISLTIQWERLTKNVPISHQYPALQLRGKIFFSAYLVFAGGIILMLILAYSCFYKAASIEEGLSTLSSRGGLIAVNAALVIILLTRQVGFAAQTVIQTLAAVAEGNLQTDMEISTRDEMGYLLLALKNMSEKIRGVLQETDVLIRNVHEGKLDARADAEAFTGG